MNIKFTSQKGFYVPILKCIQKLNKKCNQNDIINILKSSSFIKLIDKDLEQIDLNGRIRFEYVLEHALNNLAYEGFILVQDAQYLLSDLGNAFLNKLPTNYNHQKYIKTIEISTDNKYIYSNIPPYLINIGHKKSKIYGFNKYTDKYTKLLNDYLDFIELNYPTIEEICSFLKNNYSISSNSECLNSINVLRSCGLAKVMGKNLTLTKLGEWYINSYDNIALYKIFASLYNGFEEMFNIIAHESTLSIDELKNKLNVQNFDWVNTSQFDIRLRWLENMKIINNNNSQLCLSDNSLQLAQFLGVIDESEIIHIKSSEIDLQENDSATQENKNTKDTDFEYDLDDIIEDMISESGLLEEDIIEPFDNNINLSQQERNFLLNNDIANEISASDELENLEDNKLDTIDDFENIDDFFDEAISKLYDRNEDEFEDEFIDEGSKEQLNTSSNIIQIHNQKNVDSKNNEISEESKLNLSNLLIKPHEIANLINLPDNIISKIISALNMGKHIVLTGPHGSGKTSIAVILARIANQKALNNGYNLTSATENWTSLDTIGDLIDIDNKKIFKEGFILKSIRENKWLIIDEISKCNTDKCFDGFINSFYGHNTILSYMHENLKNIEIISEPTQDTYEINQYVKSKNWRMIATMDTLERQHINFSPAFIRRFAFIDIGVNNYSELIDKYFEKNDLHNDLLKSKIKTIFSQNGLLKYKDIGASSIYDLIHYISIRNNLLSEQDSIHTLLAESLELYILPQLQVLDNKVLKEVQEYLIKLFDGYDSIKRNISKAL